MSLIIKMAANKAWEKSQSAYELLMTVSENLNDVQLYLDVNKDKLPNGSEVSIDELFSLMKVSIDAINKSDIDMKEVNDWLTAIRGAA